jgi:hypothetical protein
MVKTRTGIEASIEWQYLETYAVCALKREAFDMLFIFSFIVGIMHESIIGCVGSELRSRSKRAFR